MPEREELKSSSMRNIGVWFFLFKLYGLLITLNSWYQPAIDALTLALMREFNSLGAKKSRGQVQPLVYGTFQAYLRR